MTDITGKDNLYYTVQQYNPTDIEQQAEVDVSLVYPLLQTASDYQVSISKARIDLSTIPLTRSNIPLKKYQVGLRSGTTEATAYVRQLGVSVGNYAYNASATGIITKSKYTSTGTTTLEDTIDVSATIKTVGFFCVDDFENFYLAGSATLNANIFDLFVIFDKDGSVLFSNAFYQIRALTIDRQQRIFIAEESPSGSVVLVYSNVNGEGTVALTLVETISQDFNSAPLAEIQTVCADTQIIVGSGANTITFYDGVTFAPLTTFQQEAITQLASPSAVMSSYDRFIVTDNGTANDFFYGIASGGSQSVVNMETGSSFVADVWTSDSKMAISTDGFGYGVGTDGLTWAFTYDKVTGAVGTPFMANSITTVQNIISCQNSAGFGGLFANNSGTTLYAWGSDNFADGNKWYVADTHFTPATNPFVSMDYQDSTGKIIAVSTDNNLFASSLPVLPKQFFVGDYNFTTFRTNLRQIGVGWNIQGTSNAYSELATSYTPYTNVVTGYYKNGQNAYSLSPNESGNLAVYKQSLPSQAKTATFPIIEANEFWVQGAPTTFCPAGNGYFAVSNGYYGNAHPQIFIYSETDGSFVSDITLLIMGPNVEYNMDSVTYDAKTYLAITSQERIYIYDITTPASPTLVSGFPFIPASAPIQNVFSLKWVNTPNGIPVLCALSNGTGASSSAQALFVVGFTDDTFSTFEPANSTLIYEGGEVFTTYCNALTSNHYNGELYAMVGTPTASSTQVLVFKVDTQTQTSTITLTGVANPTAVSFYYCPHDASYTYTWTEITQTTGKLATCVSIGKLNTNSIYILDTSGNAFKGTLTGGNVGSWTAVSGISGTYASMNVYPVAQTVFDGVAYAYGLTTGQTLHGSYLAGNNKIVSATRNDVSGEFLVSTSSGLVVSLAPTNLATNWSISSIANTYAVWTKNSADIDAGRFDIFTYATLIEAINEAFLEAFSRLPAGTFTEAPIMSLDYGTGLLTLTYSSDYAPTPASISKGILFNAPLIQLCFFNSTVDTIDANLRLLTLKGGSTSTVQGNRSIYQFNQLDKIVFISNTIYVFGSYFGNNNTNNIIQDIDVPTSSAGYMDNVGQVLYFQPSFLRPFMLASNNALQRVQLSVNYVYLDGTQYPLLVAPGNNWSAKLLFPRRY